MTLNPIVIGLKRAENTAEKQAIVRVELQRLISQVAPQLMGAYSQMMRLVYQHPDLSPSEAVGALTDAEKVELRVLAIVVKAMLNHFRDGTITDAIPAGQFVLPENLFPELG